MQFPFLSIPTGAQQCQSPLSSAAPPRYSSKEWGTVAVKHGAYKSVSQSHGFLQCLSEVHDLSSVLFLLQFQTLNLLLERCILQSCKTTTTTTITQFLCLPLPVLKLMVSHLTGDCSDINIVREASQTFYYRLRYVHSYELLLGCTLGTRACVCIGPLTLETKVEREHQRKSHWNKLTACSSYNMVLTKLYATTTDMAITLLISVYYQYHSEA